MKKSFYKKIFVLGAALFILLAPAGITIRSTANGAALAHGASLAFSPYSALRPSFSLNLAEATDTPPTPVGSSVGVGSVSVQNPNFFSCVSSPATCGVFYVSLVVNGAAGLLLTGGAWLVRLGLQFNDNVFNSPAIQTGFSVSLAIANLGFVLGIIIIAIATIIRNQTYGIKQLLSKLVMMAILVNFGLVITAPIVGFANDMSLYFINATSPSVATGGYEAYVTTMENAFGTQTITLSTPGTVSTLCQSWVTYIPGPWVMCHIGGQSTQSIQNSADSFWQNTMALLFDIAFSAIAAFTFICLAVLLLVRYLILGGLLIVLPLAWLTYVFPKFDNSFSKWWNTFIKWTFFPPLALFFIYLAFITAANLGNNTPQGKAAIAYQTAAIGSANDALEQGLATQTGQNGSVIGQAADEILLVGLMIMGLMFALSLSGKAGSTVVNGASTVSKAVGGYIGNQSKKGARASFRAMGGDKAVAAMRSGQLGGLQKIPGLGRAASLTGRALEPHLTNSAAVDAAKKKVPENLEQVKQNLQGSMSKEDRLAHIAKLVEKGELSKDQMVGNQRVGDFLDTHESMIANYGFVKTAKDADKVLGSNKEMRAAQAKVESATTESEKKAAQEELDKATNGFVAKLEKSDIGKMNLNDIFKKPDIAKGEKENPFAAALEKSFATTAYHLAASAMPKMKASTLKQFKTTYEAQIKKEWENSSNLKAIDKADADITSLQQEKDGGNTDIKRLKNEIERVNAMQGSDEYKKQEVQKRTAAIAKINEQINIKIETIKKQKKTISDRLTDEEKNLIEASKTFKSSLAANATGGGHEEHDAGSGSNAKTEEHH